MTILSDKTLLVQLNISQWTARKYDKKATQQVADSNHANLSAGRYNKSLLPMSDYLSDVHKKATLIRKKYYENTLPWGMEGTMMLPSANYLAFMTEFRKEKAEWEHVVTEFLTHYEGMKLDASRLLGSLYDPADYPITADVAVKFRMDMAVFPVPSNDFRVEIADEELKRIQSDIEARVTEAQQNAMKDVWQRLFDRVEHMADKLADPSSIFRDSMLENTEALCSLLPRLNFADDPDLENMRQRVERSLMGHHPDSLRNDPDLRRNTAKEAQDIASKMRVFMGVL